MSDKSAFSVNQFCEAYGLSRSSFYRMLREGLAPAIIRVGRRVLVSIEAARDWERTMQKRSAPR